VVTGEHCCLHWWLKCESINWTSTTAEHSWFDEWTDEMVGGSQTWSNELQDAVQWRYSGKQTLLDGGLFWWTIISALFRILYKASLFCDAIVDIFCLKKAF
jgi:hypothetical protein